MNVGGFINKRFDTDDSFRPLSKDKVMFSQATLMKITFLMWFQSPAALTRLAQARVLVQTLAFLKLYLNIN